MSTWLNQYIDILSTKLSLDNKGVIDGQTIIMAKHLIMYLLELQSLEYYLTQIYLFFRSL